MIEYLKSSKNAAVSAVVKVASSFSVPNISLRTLLLQISRKKKNHDFYHLYGEILVIYVFAFLTCHHKYKKIEEMDDDDDGSYYSEIAIVVDKRPPVIIWSNALN